MLGVTLAQYLPASVGDDATHAGIGRRYPEAFLRKVQRLLEVMDVVVVVVVHQQPQKNSVLGL
jgi:hypothetical protein